MNTKILILCSHLPVSPLLDWSPGIPCIYRSDTRVACQLPALDTGTCKCCDSPDLMDDWVAESVEHPTSIGKVNGLSPRGAIYQLSYQATHHTTFLPVFRFNYLELKPSGSILALTYWLATS